MLVPKTDEMLPPFFDILADGEIHSAEEIRAKLMHRFKVTEADAVKYPKNMGSFINIVAWCKARATLAKFTQKHPHNALSLTPLGLSDVKRGTQKITARYLGSFK